MEGVLDWILRDLLSEVGGFDRMVTEFVRVTERLLPAHVFYKYCPELKNDGRTRSGTPVFVQLLGGQAGPVAENAGFAAELGAPGIDLNFGCPAKTVNRHDGGASLLKNPERLFEVTGAVRRAVPSHIPVTAKVRLGFDHKNFHKEIAQAVEEAGAAHLVVHARTKAEMYTPPAHWEYIASMKEGRTLPFLANGEIWSVDDYRRCVSVCGVEQVALGRGVVRRPTLALEIQRAQGHEVTAGEFDRASFLRRFYVMSRDEKGEQFAVARLKQLLRYWSLNDPEGQFWFNKAKVLKTGAEVDQLFLELDHDNVARPARTEALPRANF